MALERTRRTECLQKCKIRAGGDRMEITQLSEAGDGFILPWDGDTLGPPSSRCIPEQGLSKDVSDV